MKNPIPTLPPDIEALRDYHWRREATRRIETVAEAEAFIEGVGFANAMTDARTAGASLYVAVCGRRDAYMPRNVQKDAEASQTWLLKDELLRRGKVYYAKLAAARTLFIRRSLIPYFHALNGVARKDESHLLSPEANRILRVLRREWELATRDLRDAAKIENRATFTRALDELQRCMKVVPLDVVYQPRFTYIWTTGEARFPSELKTEVSPDEALSAIAHAFLQTAGITLCGELARATGLTRPNAGRANQALVKQHLATQLARGVYRWHEIEEAR
ncbi:MAG: hypothetical protein MSG64_03130 [Pyrinomonadaceae bacterium MAG19_C2-C3]|nr:hypothetical protein [Pyrinomonadaceae bacterium MAG19_C2-C3]